MRLSSAAASGRKAFRRASRTARPQASRAVLRGAGADAHFLPRGAQITAKPAPRGSKSPQNHSSHATKYIKQDETCPSCPQLERSGPSLGRVGASCSVHLRDVTPIMPGAPPLNTPRPFRLSVFAAANTRPGRRSDEREKIPVPPAPSLIASPSMPRSGSCPPLADMNHTFLGRNCMSCP